MPHPTHGVPSETHPDLQSPHGVSPDETQPHGEFSFVAGESATQLEGRLTASNKLFKFLYTSMCGAIVCVAVFAYRGIVADQQGAGELIAPHDKNKREFDADRTDGNRTEVASKQTVPNNSAPPVVPASWTKPTGTPRIHKRLSDFSDCLRCATSMMTCDDKPIKQIWVFIDVPAYGVSSAAEDFKPFRDALLKTFVAADQCMITWMPRAEELTFATDVEDLPNWEACLAESDAIRKAAAEHQPIETVSPRMATDNFILIEQYGGAMKLVAIEIETHRTPSRCSGWFSEDLDTCKTYVSRWKEWSSSSDSKRLDQFFKRDMPLQQGKVAQL